MKSVPAKDDRAAGGMLRAYYVDDRMPAWDKNLDRPAQTTGRFYMKIDSTTARPAAGARTRTVRPPGSGAHRAPPCCAAVTAVSGAPAADAFQACTTLQPGTALTARTDGPDDDGNGHEKAERPAREDEQPGGTNGIVALLPGDLLSGSLPAEDDTLLHRGIAAVRSGCVELLDPEHEQGDARHLDRQHEQGRGNRPLPHPPPLSTRAKHLVPSPAP